jgi:hypothetical protein
MIKQKGQKFQQLNSLKEHVELKNVVKTQGVLFRKDRFAVLTIDRLLLFDSQTHYIEQKNPRVRK